VKACQPRDPEEYWWEKFSVLQYDRDPKGFGSVCFGLPSWDVCYLTLDELAAQCVSSWEELLWT
jgi:hypothetical protein